MMPKEDTLDVTPVPMTPISAYRIVEVDYTTGKPKSLFHTFPLQGRRTRVFPVGEWIHAEAKPVDDGGSTKYRSGFNGLLDPAAVLEYTKRFKKKRPLQVITVTVDKNTLHRKKHSRSEVYLADWMYIPEDWNYDKDRIDDDKTCGFIP